MDLIEKLYKKKKPNYFSLERSLFKNAISKEKAKVLDVGCGTGALGAFLRSSKSCTVYGVEINHDAYNIALSNLDETIYGNIENIELPNNFVDFDYIVFGDVLEHLIEPMSVLKTIKNRLNKGGVVIATVPNIRYWKTSLSLLLFDQWRYTDWGILDYTHLRFFTKSSLVEILVQNDFTIIKAEWVIQEKSISYYINKLSFGLFAGLLASHIFVSIK